MTSKTLTEKSIRQLFVTGENCIYEIPIYQRNYAWEKEEIDNLVQDIFDSMEDAKENNTDNTYYIGTLVTFHKGDNVYEVIDGQQRLTTIRLILHVLGQEVKHPLTYRARKKSDDTLKHLSDFGDIDDVDKGIVNGLGDARKAIDEIVSDKESFTNYFLDNVHVIHYQVPRDIDLNHYFEVMNSRGEQLEKHEIVKAQLMQKLSNDSERKVFNKIWQACSQMSVYVQQALELNAEKVFSPDLDKFQLQDFDDLTQDIDNQNNIQKTGKLSINEILASEDLVKLNPQKDYKDTFQPIIDFPNFLLIVLKLLRLKEPEFLPDNFVLDDKDLLKEFQESKFDCQMVKDFGKLLLKSKFLLDNYMVHHADEEDTIKNNPWQLQILRKSSYSDNLCGEKSLQDNLVHLLSMFEVSFTARQRKNYLFYILLYLNDLTVIDVKEYREFVESLADHYFCGIYLDKDKLNDSNTPLPGSFDDVIIPNNALFVNELPSRNAADFLSIFGDGSQKSKGVPLFVFNYCDYKIWKLYQERLRGEKLQVGSPERREFFDVLGCSDFGLDVFNDFYFSRTRRSLEHYYPQATADGEDGHLNEQQINCFGNFAMIGNVVNSTGSNWDPKTKLSHYLEDASGKINKVSVASLKFMIMMQMCKDCQKWDFEEIRSHQEKMMRLLNL